MIVALAGGVGGARLAFGLSRVLQPGELTVIVNTGDDFDHLGLRICPDLDTVMYTLAGLESRELGWGLAGETWGMMTALERLGGPTWFRLGDRDIATHLYRTQALSSGRSLSAVTAELCARLDVHNRLAPMSDDPVRTIVDSEDGAIEFQDYFVHRHCAPAVRGFHFEGATTAKANPLALEALADPRLQAIIFCPSNPWVSIGPILAIEGIDRAIRQVNVPRIAVSPIVGGAAVKGPAAKMMRELGYDVSPLSVARHYRGIIDNLAIDRIDAEYAAAIEAIGIKAHVCNTLMTDDDSRIKLAHDALRVCQMVS